MLDPNFIESHPEQVQAMLASRGQSLDTEIDALVLAIGRRRELLKSVEALRKERNEISREVGRLRKAGEDAAALQAQSRELGDRLAAGEEALDTHNRDLDAALASVPNLLADDVPSGGKEANQVISVVGETPEFGFPVRDHVELSSTLGLIDHGRGAKLAGSGFWAYRGLGAALEWALLTYFIDAHRDAGYDFVLPPHILNEDCGYAAGQFPKFADEVFVLEHEADAPRSFLLPTAETALAGFHRDETFAEDALPLKYVAYSPCYRREIGSYRAADRGTLRGHQFNKVELFQLVDPDASAAAHEELIGRACSMVDSLGLHYRTSLLAGGDTGNSMSRTVDIEVWMPSLDQYIEVSSVSNARDYQARRANTRVKRETGPSAYVHTLNGSGLATSRVFAAILEQNQQEDGSVVVPPVLVPYLRTEVLRPD